MGKAFLYGNGGGSGTGGTLTVTAPAGVTVSASKDGRTKTRVANADGVAVFRGLKTGTWTVTITDGNQTASKPVVITADYSTIMAFFAATINVTYPSGSTCTATDGTTTLTAPDTSGTWACSVPNAGAWTVTATDGDKTKSGDVGITENGQSESITLQYITYLFKDGATYDTLTGGWNATIDSTKNTMSIYAGAGKTISVSTKNAVDVTAYDVIYFDSIGYLNGPNELTLILSTTSAGTAVASVSLAVNATHATLDVSSITGSYFVRLSLYSEKGASALISEVAMQ